MKTNNTKKSKTPYINSIPIKHGEITIVTSDHAEATMHHSSRLASAAQQVGVGVLLINCGMSNRRFREHFYSEHTEVYDEPRLIVKSSVVGNLVGERDNIDQICREAKIGVVIIAGWEFASDNYRRRHRLISYLRGLMEEQDVAVVIYAHTANEPVAGTLDHGGLGKLTLLAYAVTRIEASEMLETAVKKPAPRVATTNELNEFERGAQAFVKEINDLPGIGPRTDDFARAA